MEKPLPIKEPLPVDLGIVSNDRAIFVVDAQGLEIDAEKTGLNIGAQLHPIDRSPGADRLDKAAVAADISRQLSVDRG